jgi:glycosyltransferase involved in cell wall biosynthesis
MTLQQITKKEQATISVIVPCYNRGLSLSKMLHDTITGLEKNRIEFILTDDSSEEDSSYALENLSAEFKKIVVYKKNKNRLGYCKNLINAINLSTGDYLFFLLDEDSIVLENFNFLINEINSGKYHIMSSSSKKEDVNVKKLNATKVPRTEVVGELRHTSGLVMHRELVLEALSNKYVVNAIDKTPQYPQVPIGLYCVSKYNMYRHNFAVTIFSFDGNSGSDWTQSGTVPRYNSLISRAIQVEVWAEMLYFMMKENKSNKFPFIVELKSSFDELIYILLEQGVVRIFDKESILIFYKRSAINSIRWLFFNRSITSFFRILLDISKK